MTQTGCPFQPSAGYATAQGRSEWLSDRGVGAKKARTISKSMHADPDVSKPLYFWQIYSLIGQKAIYAIVENFYVRVYADTEAPWFRDAFTRIGSMEHHIYAQAAYWVDVMGGGKHYHGGSYRIDFHHSHNASQVMNASGASRWMHHMRGALNDQHFQDRRVKPCIVDFLRTKMKKYAEEHKWKFDEGDFDFGGNAIRAPVASVSADVNVSDEEDKKEEDA